MLYNRKEKICFVISIQQLMEKAIRNRYYSLIKQQQIENKDYQLIGRFSYSLFKSYQDGNYSTANFYLRLLNDIENEHNEHYIKVAKLLNQGRARKSKNIKERITYMLEEYKQAYFITFTFNDSTLLNTNALTRRRYVIRALKNSSNDYLANIDFGADNGREHYHAVSTQPLLQEHWSYGFIKCIRIGHSESEPAKVGKYITKLNNHALKRSTRGNVRFNPIIYSRDSR